MENNTIWTLEALKEHYDVVLKNQYEHYKILLAERDERVTQRYQAMELAVNKAEVATEKRFECVNEFRAQLGDQSRTLMPRIETEVLLKNANDKIDALTIKVEKSENIKAGGNAMIAYIVAGISILITIITLLGKFWVK
jgi:hypothetical protein